MNRKNQGFPLQLAERCNQKQSSAYLDNLRLAACSTTKPAPMAAVSTYGQKNQRAKNKI